MRRSPPPSRWLLAAAAAAVSTGLKVAVLHADCPAQGFCRLAITGTELSAQKYPEDHIYEQTVDDSNCSSFVTAAGAQHDLLIFAGFQYESCALDAAARFPNTWVAQVDDCPDGARSHRNFVCALFVESEPSFAAGYLAGLVSVTKVAGIVGGMPLPPVQRLFNAFRVGVQASCPECLVEGVYVNSFAHPDNAYKVAAHLVQEVHADVVFGCGGDTGTAAIQRAAELGSMVVGVDTDAFVSGFSASPNDVRSRVVTSVLKRIDKAVEAIVDSLRGHRAGDAVPGVEDGQLNFDYASSGVGIADCHLACAYIGPLKWGSVRMQENLLASKAFHVDLDGYAIPLIPEGSPPNTFRVVPNSAQPPPPRVQPAMAIFSVYLLDYVLVFGGRAPSGDVLGDLWLFNVQAGMWMPGSNGMLDGPPPPPLAKACAVALGPTVVLFGGRTADGGQSNTSYRFSYQPDFLGYQVPASPLIRNRWAALSARGDVPLPVEGAACAPLNETCGLVYGGRAQLAPVSGLYVFCLEEGDAIRWARLPAGRLQAPSASEGAGLVTVDAAVLGLEAGRAAVIAGGLAGGSVSSAEVWLYNLDGEPTWTRLPDLPKGLVAPAVFTADAPAAPAEVLAVQPGGWGAAAWSGFDAFTYDAELKRWNSQSCAFSPANLTRPAQAAVASGAGYLWLLGDSGAGLMASAFQVRTRCAPGSELSGGVSCKPCAVGKSSAQGALCRPCWPGMYASSAGASACAVCDAGRYAADTGQSACPPCPQGSYGSAEGRPCEACPAGSYGEGVGAASLAGCSPCPRGKYTGNATGSTGEAACVACEAGRALSVPIGQTRCAACPAGTFADTAQAECGRCPQGRFQGAEGGSACEDCQAALPGSTTQYLGAESAADCVCDAGSYRAESDRDRCSPCPRGMQCPLGSDLSNYAAVGHAADAPAPIRPYPLLQPRYWSDPSEPVLVFVCENEFLCPGGDPGTCAPDTHGRSCTACAQGHFLTKRGCRGCRAVDLLPGAVVAAAVISGLAVVTWFSSSEGGSERLTVVTAMLVAGQLVFCVQVFGVMRQLDLVWVQPVSQVLDWAALVSFDLAQLNAQCFVGRDSPVLLFALQLLTVPLAAVEILLVLAAAAWRGARQGPGARASGGQLDLYVDRFINTIGLVLVVVYVSITIAMLRPMHCVEHPNAHRLRSMASKLGIFCWRPGEHAALVALGILGVLAYPVSLLACVGHVIWRQPALVAGDSGHVILRRCRFIFDRFKPECYYWGFFFLLRNLLLPLVPIICPDSFIGQVALMSGVLLASLAAASYLMPWKTWLANVTEAAGLLGLALFMQMAAYLGGAESGVAADPRTVSMVLVVLIIVLFSLGVSVIVFCLYRRCMPGHRYTVFVSHHKEAAGSLARWVKLQITARSFATVFLDSDQLEEIDAIVDIARYGTRNLVVLLTRMTLSRIWCAAEVTGASEARVHTVPVACCDYTPPDEDFLRKLDSRWTSQELYTVAQYGVTPAKIEVAYRAFVKLSALRLYRFTAAAAQQRVVRHILGACGVRVAGSVGSKDTLAEFGSSMSLGDSPKAQGGQRGAQVIILGAHADAEARATCEVLRHLFQAQIPQRVAAVYSRFEAAAHRHSASSLFVLLTRGLLEDTDFEAVSLEFAGEEREQAVELIPILADSHFTFPTEDFYKSLHERAAASSRSLGSSEASLCVFELHLRSLFNVVALPFSPHASAKLQSEQVLQLLRRLQMNRMRITQSQTMSQRLTLSAEHKDKARELQSIPSQLWDLQSLSLDQLGLRELAVSECAHL